MGVIPSTLFIFKMTLKEKIQKTLLSIGVDNKKKYFFFALYIFVVWLIMSVGYVIYFAKTNPELFEARNVTIENIYAENTSLIFFNYSSINGSSLKESSSSGS